MKYDGMGGISGFPEKKTLDVAPLHSSSNSTLVACINK
jgi:hypothetical protein